MGRIGKDRGKNDSHLHIKYRTEPKKVIEMILSDTKVNTSPSIEKITEYGQTKTPDPPVTDWTNCPIIDQGPEFQFKKITETEVLSVLSKTKKI